MKDKDDIRTWRSIGVPCKKGGLFITCKNCGEQKFHRHLLGIVAEWLKCPFCGSHEFRVFRSTETIRDRCDNCDESCKIADPWRDNAVRTVEV